MRVTGIIAECNPLHEGHIYLLDQARRRTCADYIVVAVSGDYVQRGAPSILSREIRTRSLLEAGADLVVELPLYVSCSGADYFARGAVSLLENLGVITDLAFGSETGDLDALLAAADMLNEETDEFRENLRRGLKAGLSFPKARTEAMPGTSLPDTPNDLLGMEYLRALKRSESSMRPLAVKRIPCSSASQIREAMIHSRLDRDPFLCRDDFSDLLLHALYRAGSSADLTCFLDVTEDLAGRIIRELPSYTSYTQFCEIVKTRNFTYTRVSRSLLHILLGMTAREMEVFDNRYGLCGWIRPAGFKRSAAPLVRSIAENAAVPLLDKLAKARDVLPEDLYLILNGQLRAEYLYDLMVRRRTGSTADTAVSAFRKPVIITD